MDFWRCRLIRNILRAWNFLISKLYFFSSFSFFLLHHTLAWVRLHMSIFQHYFVWLRITDEGSISHTRLCLTLTNLSLYCKRGNFRVGVIFAFRDMTFFAKISLAGKPIRLVKEIGEISWKLPPREKSCQHFREIFPSENNHVYSIEVLYSSS